MQPALKFSIFITHKSIEVTTFMKRRKSECSVVKIWFRDDFSFMRYLSQVAQHLEDEFPDLQNVVNAALTKDRESKCNLINTQKAFKKFWVQEKQSHEVLKLLQEKDTQIKELRQSKSTLRTENEELTNKLKVCSEELEVIFFFFNFLKVS